MDHNRLPGADQRRFSAPDVGPGKLRGSIWSGLMAILLLGPVLQQAHAQPVGNCVSGMFLSQGGPPPEVTSLYCVDTQNNPLQYPLIGAGNHRYNALGYNPIDGNMYAIVAPESNTLLRVYNDGSTEAIGLIKNLPPSGNYNSGAFDDQGTYYVRPANENNYLYKVDLATMSATRITLRGGGNQGDVKSADMAYIDGLLYTVSDEGQLYSINPNTGVVTAIGKTYTNGGSFGAIFGASTGLFASHNSGGFYQINLKTGARTLISGSPPSTNNDGTNSPLVPITFGADLSVTKTNTPEQGPDDLPDDFYTPGAPRTYTIVVRNNGPFGASGIYISDPLPAGITTVSWTCTGQNGGICGAASGSGAIDDNAVGLPVDATVTYELTMTVPAGHAGDLSNKVTVTPGVATNDPDSSNNTAEDVDQQKAVADLWITKTNTPEAGARDPDDDVLLSGARTTYDIVFGNNGPSNVANAKLADIPQSGLGDCSLATPACEVLGGTATCPVVGSAPGQLSIGNLAAGDVQIPLLGANASARIRIACTVE